MADFDRLQSFGDVRVVEASGPAIPADGFVACADLDILASDSPGFGWFDLTVNFSMATFAGVSPYALRIYSQHLAIDGAVDEPPPSPTNLSHYQGGIRMLEQAAAQPRTLQGLMRSPSESERIWLHNTSPQAVDAGWRAVVTLRTDKYIV